MRIITNSIKIGLREISTRFVHIISRNHQNCDRIFPYFNPNLCVRTIYTEALIHSYTLNEKLRLRSNWADAQADLSIWLFARCTIHWHFYFMAQNFIYVLIWVAFRNSSCKVRRNLGLFSYLSINLPVRLKPRGDIRRVFRNTKC